MEEAAAAANSTDAPRRLTVADLLRLRRPTTGASSLLFPSAPASASPPRKKPKLATATPNSARNHNTAPFAPICHPVLLSGKLSLPSTASPAACGNNCFSFSFSDTSAPSSVCCCLLEFDPAAVGQEIRVLAWNYLPSVRLHGAPGVLELVRWCLAEEPMPAPKLTFLAKIPLTLPAKEPDLATLGCVFGVVRSVSVVFNMPRVKADGSDNSVGFLAEMMCCGCHRCRVSQPESCQGHKFEVVKFIYFVESASMLRPVLVCLVGRLVYVSGLTKNMVSTANKGSYTMLISSTKIAMAWCPSYRGNLPLGHLPENCGGGNLTLDGLPENCGGVYTGVITGIYMQGAVVELDDTMWLLVDDLDFSPPHSLRVGAVISVNNFRAMRLKFAWTGSVLLATCSKTSITVTSFSVVDSKSHMKAESKSLLRMFVESLYMPARFWMFLTISCFKQKFTKKFSDKEILGSQNVPTEARIGLHLCY